MYASAAAECLQGVESANDQGFFLLARPSLDLPLTSHRSRLGGVLFLEHEQNGATYGRPNRPAAVLVTLYASRNVFGVTDVIAPIATAQDVNRPSQRAPRLTPLARDIRLAAWALRTISTKGMACHERAAAILFAAASRMEPGGTGNFLQREH